MKDYIKKLAEKDRVLVTEMIGTLQNENVVIKKRLENLELSDRLSVMLINGIKVDKSITLEENVINTISNYLGICSMFPVQ